MPDDASSHVKPPIGQPPRSVPIAELACLLAGPGLAFGLMHFHPVLQNGFLDPYIYTGYINNFVDLFERYGVTYYGVRFGIILPGQMATALFGPVWGYFVLRYALALLAGLPFYALIGQRYGRPAATAVFAVLITSPFLARTILWDHPDASGVPFLFAAICVWSLEHQRRVLLDIVAGVCAAMAIHSNVFAAVPLSIYLGVYAVTWLAWGRGLAPIGRRLLVLAAPVAIVTVLGVTYYWCRVGQADLFSITFGIASWLTGGGMANWRTPGMAWTMDKWWVLTPVFLAVLALLAWIGRRIEFLDVVFWASASVTTLFFYVFQFLLHANSLELFYYFSYTLPSVFLLLALIVRPAWEHLGSRTRWLCAGLLVTAATGPWATHSFEWTTLYPTRFEQHLAIVGAVAALLLLSTQVRHARPLTALLLSTTLGLMAFSSFARPVYSAAINSRLHPAHLEMDVYRVAVQLTQMVPPLSRQPGAIRFWYSNQPPRNAIQSIQSTYLWQYSKVQGDGEGLPYLGQQELQNILHPTVRWLALLAEEPGQLDQGGAALLEHAVAYTVVSRRALTAGAYTLHVELLELHKDN